MGCHGCNIYWHALQGCWHVSWSCLHFCRRVSLTQARHRHVCCLCRPATMSCKFCRGVYWHCNPSARDRHSKGVSADFADMLTWAARSVGVSATPGLHLFLQFLLEVSLAWLFFLTAFFLLASPQRASLVIVPWAAYLLTVLWAASSVSGDTLPSLVL